MSTAPAVVFAALLCTASLGAQGPALDPKLAGPADRIWSDNPDEAQLWLRRTFELPKGVTEARLVFTCDNECRAFVNGEQVADAEHWEDVTVVDLEGLTKDNVLAFDANNTGGPGAFACWLLWTDARGVTHELVSDASFRVTTEQPGGDWRKAEFDDTQWSLATPNFTSTFGRNLYNGAPTQVHMRNRFADCGAGIARALQRLRWARDSKTALECLDAIERATIEARAQLLRDEAARRSGKGR